MENNIYNTDDRTLNEDKSQEYYKKEYGNYVLKDLVPQLKKLSALKMTSEPYSIIYYDEKDEEISKKVNERLKEIISKFNWNAIAYVLEEKLSFEGNSVISFEKKSDTEFNIYVPTTEITRVDPANDKLYYLQTIRYLYGGDLINVVSEVRTLESTTYSITQFNSTEEADKAVKEVVKAKGKEISGGKKVSPKEAELDFLPDKPIPNTSGKIQAVYFENLPTIDKRGRSDFNLDSRYVKLLDQTIIRFFWELDFNKSKLFMGEEVGLNYGASMHNQAQMQQMLNSGLAVRRNSFSLSTGMADSAYSFNETTNQNLINLTTMFNYFLKKWWEQSGQHQSGSDIGKQISDYQAVQEKSAETLIFKNKVLRRKHTWRNLFFDILNEIKEFKGKLKKENLKINIAYTKIDVEETVIKNEIMKIQANLTNREAAIQKVQELDSSTDIEALTKRYLDTNIEDIETELKAKPIQVQTPGINNPQGKENNQKKSFMDQLDKKEER